MGRRGNPLRQSQGRKLHEDPQGKRMSAAKLAVILAGESPANRGGPVAVVVISSNGKGDRPVESLEVKAPGGRFEYRSDPYRGCGQLLMLWERRNAILVDLLPELV